MTQTDRERALERCLGFFASVIKSGEPWTETCEREYRAALAAPSPDPAPTPGPFDQQPYYVQLLLRWIDACVDNPQTHDLYTETADWLSGKSPAPAPDPMMDWKLSPETERAIAEIDDNASMARANARNFVVGSAHAPASLARDAFCEFAKNQSLGEWLENDVEGFFKAGYAAALRRAAGVTDEMVEAALLAYETKIEGPKSSETIEANTRRSAMRRALTATAKARVG